ncbi:unnamed protein product [Diabrotica balteata]|uniref:EGF-like domain-containing protein n=1 Tax=Diabrotica balteata TaxID=107213 RepID=A0A9N9SUL8_DIABA|nr:unnamed protein product [Diabrotica balteata]
MQRRLIHIVLSFCSILHNILGFNGLEPPINSLQLPPCKACKTFVESFHKGLERTSKYKYEGGDTAWEEEKLGTYATSEVRFVEIQEKLCSEVHNGKDQCYKLLEEYEDTLEEWWFDKQSFEPDLFNYLCVKSYQVCCPDLHYGKDCQPCPGFPDNVCSNNGKCKGAGTRKGNGQCQCEEGYTGDNCNTCNTTHYIVYQDEKKVLCAPCHISCADGCTKQGPDGCNSCRPGWTQDSEKTCRDINECAAEKSPCTPLQFCVNMEGSYTCMDCDKSCGGCTGNGPDMCINCARGFYKKDNVCVDQAEEKRRTIVSFSRYFTYLGLCVATCIIFPRNSYIAAVVGLAVACYITVSEYTLNSTHTIQTSGVEQQVSENVLKAITGEN